MKGKKLNSTARAELHPVSGQSTQGVCWAADQLLPVIFYIIFYKDTSDWFDTHEANKTSALIHLRSIFESRMSAFLSLFLCGTCSTCMVLLLVSVITKFFHSQCCSTTWAKMTWPLPQAPASWVPSADQAKLNTLPVLGFSNA